VERFATAIIALAQVCVAHIRLAWRGRDQIRPTRLRILIEPRSAQSGPAQVRLAQIGPYQHGGIEQSAAQIGAPHPSTAQHPLGQQGGRHFRPGETGIFKARRLMPAAAAI